MRHIVSLSGGKDSTAMLLRMIELGMPIDEIRFFDGGWEFPQMYEHIEQLKELCYPFEIKVVKPKASLMEIFEKLRYFPQVNEKWCTREKINAISKGLKRTDLLYLGYAYSEHNRILKRRSFRCKEVYPLVEWGWTEKDCLKYCYQKGLHWNGLYEIFDRVSCWCCPFQPKRSLYKLWKYFPELWEKLKEMQRIAKNTFKPNVSVFDLEEEFKLKEKQYELFE